MRPHTVSGDTFDLLARGAGETLGVLRAGQRSKRLLLLRELMVEAERRAPQLLADAEGAHSFAVLVEAHRQSPQDVDALLLEPHVGAWINRCLRGLLIECDTRPENLGHLGAVAAVAALRVGQAFEVTAYLRDGSLVLPTLGSAQLPAASGWCRVRSSPEAEGVEIATADTTLAVPFTGVSQREVTWAPLRRLRSVADGVAIDVLVDDLDPFRGCGHLPVADRLEVAIVEDWQAKLNDAWALLVSDHRARAEAIAAGITTIVPLRPTQERTELSATCHEAIGAMAMTPPKTPLSLALALVHEFQHTKLSALLDLVPLLSRSGDNIYYAPWRPDPRSLSGLLQGTYAYLGLAEFWDRYRRGPESPGHDRPGGDWRHFEFALGCSQVRQAIDDLRAAGELTPDGIRFVAGMRRRIGELSRRPVPTLPQSLARLAALDHATSWRLRNLRPDPDEVDERASAWLAGTSHPWDEHRRATVVDGAGPLPSDGRLTLLRRRLAFPDRWRTDTTWVAAVTPADLALAAGDFAEAADRYGSQINERPDDLPSWAGLALARRRARTPGTKALTEVPEVVVAVHGAVRARSGMNPDPDALAAWLTG